MINMFVLLLENLKQCLFNLEGLDHRIHISLGDRYRKLHVPLLKILKQQSVLVSITHDLPPQFINDNGICTTYEVVNVLVVLHDLLALHSRIQLVHNRKGHF